MRDYTYKKLILHGLSISRTYDIKLPYAKRLTAIQFHNRICNMLLNIVSGKH